jgi:hypothetical protein
MSKRPYNVWIISSLLRWACDRFALAFAGFIHFTVTLVETLALPGGQRKTPVIVRVRRSNTAFDPVYFACNHPISVISGDFDIDDRRAKLAPYPLITISNKPMAVNVAHAVLSQHLEYRMVLYPFKICLSRKRERL